MGRESPEQILTREYVPKIHTALVAGLSLRDAARLAGVSLGTVQKVKAVLNGSLEATSECKLITRADLPRGDLEAIWTFAAEKYREVWGQRWTWYEADKPYRTSDDPAYYIHVFGFLRYIGETRREVINNILYMLNTGKDDPIKRLRLTNAEKRALRALKERYGRAVHIDSLTDAEKAIYKRLLIKRLVRNDHGWGYTLSVPGEQLQL